MIRNWVGYKCRLSPKQLMITCMLLLEVACRYPESRKILTTLYKLFPYGCRLRTPNVQGEGVDSMRTPADKGGEGVDQKLIKSCGHLLCITYKYDFSFRSYLEKAVHDTNIEKSAPISQLNPRRT